MIKTNRAGRRAIVAATVLLALVFTALLAWQRLAFPTTGFYRQLIASADRVEVRGFFINDEPGGTDFLILMDRQDINKLAEGFRIVGFWTPFDELTANTYRLRVIKDGRSTYLVIRGGTLVQSGSWHAKIDDELMVTVRRLAGKGGATMPDWRAMMRRPSGTKPSGTRYEDKDTSSNIH